MCMNVDCSVCKLMSSYFFLKIWITSFVLCKKCAMGNAVMKFRRDRLQRRVQNVGKLRMAVNAFSAAGATTAGGSAQPQPPQAAGQSDAHTGDKQQSRLEKLKERLFAFSYGQDETRETEEPPSVIKTSFQKVYRWVNTICLSISNWNCKFNFIQLSSSASASGSVRLRLRLNFKLDWGRDGNAFCVVSLVWENLPFYRSFFVTVYDDENKHDILRRHFVF